MLFRGPNGVAFAVPDEWLQEAGAGDFSPPSSCYAVTPDCGAICMPLQDIEPPRRAPGILGLHRGQLVSVLRAMVAGDALPPVPVEVLAYGPYRCMPRDGFHRFHASIALGFTHLPVLAVHNR